MSFGPTAEEKRWAARKACMFAAMGGSAGDVSDFENWHHPAVLKGEVRRYEAAMKHAVAARTTTAAECAPCWSQVFHFDGVGWRFKPVPVGGYKLFAADMVVEVFEADQGQVIIFQEVCAEDRQGAR